MTIRETLARWLAPTVARDAHRYQYLLASISEDKQWLTEFPQVRAALDRVYFGHLDHYRAIGAPTRCEQPHEIWRFREQLRAERDAERSIKTVAPPYGLAIEEPGDALEYRAEILTGEKTVAPYYRSPPYGLGIEGPR